MGVEKTVIRDSKSNSGIIGLTRKASALLRWTMTQHTMGEYATVMRPHSGLHQSGYDIHEQNLESAMKRMKNISHCLVIIF